MPWYVQRDEKRQQISAHSPGPLFVENQNDPIWLSVCARDCGRQRWFFPVTRNRTSPSAHRGDVLRRDLEDHSYFAGLSKRIFILIQIFLRHFINVRVRSARRTFAHTTTDFKVSIRIVGIGDRHGHTTITLQVLVLLSPCRSVEDHPFTIVVDPHWRHL